METSVIEAWGVCVAVGDGMQVRDLGAASPPVLDETALRRLRSLAESVARPGEDVLGDIAVLFIDDSQARVAALRTAWAAGHSVDARRHAHTLKGAAGHVGAVFVVKAAGAIEADCARPVDEAALDELAHHLETAWAALRAEFGMKG